MENFKLKSWQEEHRNNGYHVERLSGGQVRAYGPTIFKYIVIKLEQYGRRDVRKYCVEIVHGANDPKEHDLLMHIMEFKRIGPRTYYYECGHDYTG